MWCCSDPPLRLCMLYSSLSLRHLHSIKAFLLEEGDGGKERGRKQESA